VRQHSAIDEKDAVTRRAPKLYVSRPDNCDTKLGEPNKTGFMPTNDKEKSTFYLKLQWISAKDDAERETLAKKIRQILAEQTAPSKKG
jgi:hypothetical protein